MAFAFGMSVNVKEVHGAGIGNLGEFWFRLIGRDKQIVQEEVAPVIPLVMEKIAWCESRGKQFNPDGTVRRGKQNPKDVGKYQINEFYHLDSSIKMGIDIYTEEGNTEYALYLYETQGTRPWNWSKPCWGQDLTLEQLKAKYK
ncbi:MAG TPA: hypothetical protein PKV66_02560 [Candidatus Pelethenecus sp.]|nr:hypothetical protein [Candidatus Pelethenecus sp.]